MSSTSRSSSSDVTVLGCGLMGAALIQTWAANDFSVTAWNRTLSKATALAGPRITAVSDIGEAVAASPLVVACTDTLESLRSVLDPIEEWGGTTLANLVGTTPQQSEDMAASVEQRGGQYLDGSIVCYPSEVGTENGHFIYSGPEDVWTKNEKALAVLGPYSVSFASQAMASTLMAGLTSFYIPALSAFVASVTYLRDKGATADDISGSSRVALDLLRRHMTEAVQALDAGHHRTDQATIETFAKGARNRIPEFRAEGYRMPLLQATLQLLEEAEAAGLGNLDFYAQAKVL